MAMERGKDDVIRIRIDATEAVADFGELLSRQAAEGEQAAPAKPANRAVFRELAPFRLVEYSYVDPALEGVEGVYIGFADGSLFSVTEEIPEAVVDAMLAADLADLPPIYVYVVLGQPCSYAEIDHFMDALAKHLGRPLVAVFRDHHGAMGAHAYALDGSTERREALARECTRSVLEANWHLDKARITRRLTEHNLAADGRAFARLSYKFAQHVAEFANSAERDDFIAWSRILCEWIYARWCSWEDIGLNEILRPAEIAAEPMGEIVSVRLLPPSAFEGGSPWWAFGGADAATALHFTQSDAASNDEALRQSLELARHYWRYVTDTVAHGEMLARALTDSRRRRGMKLE